MADAGGVDILTPRAQQPTPNEGDLPPFERLLAGLIYSIVGVLFLYALFYATTFQREMAPPAPAGWRSLSPCSVMVSFDGRRHLSLDENHFARIEEPDQPNVDGSWSFVQITNKYSITLNGEPVTYSVVAPGDGDYCMLIRGDLVTADLPRSWFSSRLDLDYQDDRDPPER